MKLIPLGINGYLPLRGRHTSCFLLRDGDTAWLLDAGTGAARLHEPAIRAHLEGCRDLHLLLSHYHVDHSVGLYYAFTAWRHGTLHIHAPVCPFMPVNPEEAIRRYFSPPLNSYLLETTTITICPLNAPEQEIAGRRVTVWAQQHPGGSVGLRIDDAIAYVTDTVVMPENAAHVRGVDLLLHELWLNDADAQAQDGERNRHACFSPVADFVRAAAPRRVMPCHLYPHYDDATLTAMTRDLATASGIPAELPVEGQVYELDRTP
jgi:ribonuclease BN (tRNA processing enzyme)